MSDYPNESPDDITENDSDPSNVIFRAGYLRGLAMRAVSEDDRVFLFRAARSLRAFHSQLTETCPRCKGTGLQPTGGMDVALYCTCSEGDARRSGR